MKLAAKFQIDEKFDITGKGIIFTGFIKQGDINTGNFIKLNINGVLIKRKIIGRELTRNPHNFTSDRDKRYTGILIEFKDEEEIKNIKESHLKNIEALIFEKQI